MVTKPKPCMMVSRTSSLRRKSSPMAAPTTTAQALTIVPHSINISPLSARLNNVYYYYHIDDPGNVNRFRFLS
jgi:hypothetical protein